MSDQVECDSRIELAFNIARYLLRHPGMLPYPLYTRVAVLSSASADEMERLLPEVEYWMTLLMKEPQL